MERGAKAHFEGDGNKKRKLRRYELLKKRRTKSQGLLKGRTYSGITWNSSTGTKTAKRQRESKTYDVSRIGIMEGKRRQQGEHTEGAMPAMGSGQRRHETSGCLLKTELS